MAPDSTLVNSNQSPPTWFARSIELARRTIRTDDLLHHGGIMAVATIASGGCNYAYQVFVGRSLGPEQYGVFGALFALFYLANVLGRGIRFSASRYAAEFDDRHHSLAPFYRGLLVRSLLFSVLVFAGLAAASPAVGGFLGVESPWLVLLAVASVPVGLTLTANQGAMQGLQWFAPLGGYKVLLAVVKLGLGVLLVVAGYGVYGAFGAVVLATLFVLVASTVHVRTRLPPADSAATRIEYHRAYRYVPPAVLAGFCLTVPGTVDVIVAQHAFAGREAGLYTAVSVLGKILVFLPLGICAALFPKVSHTHVVADRDRLNGLLRRALLYAGGIAATGALLYALVPALILDGFFGAAYVAGAPLLQWYGVAVFAFALASVLLNFELARDRMRYVYVFTGGSVVEIGLLWAAQDTLVGMAQVVLLVNTALFAYGLHEVRQ